MSQLNLFIVVGAILLTWLAFVYYRHTKKQQLFLQPIKPEWEAILNTNVALYSMLPDTLRIELHGHIQLFLSNKEFFGNEIEINDEIKLTIAGNACMLLLQGMHRNFENFTTIIVHPDTYVSNQVQLDGMIEHQKMSARAGESWVRGPIVLSWKDVLNGSIHPRNGHNVVLHEFAHKLDELNTTMDGLPILKEQSQYDEWTKIFRNEYAELKIRAQKGTNKVLDEYGTVSPPEFFAVATESFFEKPKKMRKNIPALYEQLKKFYCVDPATW